MLRVERLNIGYQSGLLKETVDFEIQSGFTALIGRNGTGKTTFLKTISGHLKPLTGICKLDGVDIYSLSTQQLATKISIVNTEKIRLSYLKVHELLALGRFPYTNFIGQLSDDDEAVINKIVQRLQIEHLLNKYLESLSDGELQKIMIARAIVQDTPIVILDEPTTHLDLVNRYQIFQLLKSLSQELNKIILLSTHEIELALQLADNVILINEKSELIAATLGDFIKKNHIQNAFKQTGISFDNKTLRFKFR
ncbi:MAG: ABC transporter ATP-binding protein [Saprospiraceae bacterium]